MARSTDMVDWTYAGDAFSAENRPSWAAPDAGIWAPDVRYIDGRYVMYYGVTDTTLYPGRNDGAIGVATAPSPTGPWTDSGRPVVGPRPGARGAEADDFLWTFDSTGFTDVDGKHYLYFGSYYGGISVTELTSDGLRAVGPTPRIAIDNRYEAAYVVRHEGWVYFFGSSANCCAGPTTGYSVYVGRSRSPLEPPVDRDGISLNESRVGGTVVITPNGNRWIGPGHNAIATDLSGQDWFVYHAIDRADPYLDEPFGSTSGPCSSTGWTGSAAGRPCAAGAGRPRGRRRAR
jgi:beta-xylosidase